MKKLIPPLAGNPFKKGRKVQGFTLVELVIVIMILIILSSVTFISYISQISNARNSARVSDMGNIKMSLKNHKLKQGGYPTPGNSFDITNSGTIIKQGFLNDKVYTQEITKKPTDPLVKSQYYFYSTTNNKLFFQIAMSIEDDSLNNEYNMRAYIDGDYQTLNDGFIPSIVFATTSSGSIQTLSGTFIVDKGSLNLPYDKTGNIVNNATSLSEIIGESGVEIPKFYGFYSCLEIYENGNSMGSGTYMLLDNNQVTSTGCIMDY